jgi:hypothetical protein
MISGENDEARSMRLRMIMAEAAISVLERNGELTADVRRATQETTASPRE